MVNKIPGFEILPLIILSASRTTFIFLDCDIWWLSVARGLEQLRDYLVGFLHGS